MPFSKMNPWKVITLFKTRLRFFLPFVLILLLALFAVNNLNEEKPRPHRIAGPETVAPSLEPGFQKPANWQWRYFTNRQGYRLRYGSAQPPGTPKAWVIIAQGLDEFSEKHFETVHELLDRGYGVAGMDWISQGLSDRLLDNPEKRHSYGFAQEEKDFEYFVDNIVPGLAKNDLPVILLGQSFGGHIILLYLQEHSSHIAKAVVMAPMLDIKTNPVLHPFVGILSFLIDAAGFGDAYVFGYGNWTIERYKKKKTNNGKQRRNLHSAWLETNPALQVGGPTFLWLHQATRSMAKLNKGKNLKRITTPVLLFQGGQDTRVNNGAIRKAAAIIPAARIVLIEEAGHEILMGNDAVRKQFWENFDDFTK